MPGQYSCNNADCLGIPRDFVRNGYIVYVVLILAGQKDGRSVRINVGEIFICDERVLPLFNTTTADAKPAVKALHVYSNHEPSPSVTAT